MQNETLVIRNALPADHPFIYDSLLNNYQHTSYFAKRIPKNVFMRCHSALINQLVQRPNTKIKIAGDEDYTIFGYLIAELINDLPPIIHYVYVRPEFQKLGIAKKLIASLNIAAPYTVSHWTPVMNEISNKFKNDFIYNPYLI